MYKYENANSYSILRIKKLNQKKDIQIDEEILKNNYRISFGYSFVCICPVRKELFNRYNI